MVHRRAGSSRAASRWGTHWATHWTPHWAASRGALAVLLASLATGGCDGPDRQPSPAARGRSDRVAATGATAQPPATGQPGATPSAPRASSSPTGHRRARRLCPPRELQPAPEPITASRAVAGAARLAPLHFGGGRWQWVNLWAAWCEPCKQEIPRLLQWRDQLRAQGVPLDLAFVSIDDDEREMTRFLRSQPPTGVRASYWLETEETRSAWFESVGLHDTPTLPIHVLVTPQGKLTCIIQGALEPEDYPQLAAAFRRHPRP